jgi:hypothetical protein
LQVSPVQTFLTRSPCCDSAQESFPSEQRHPLPETRKHLAGVAQHRRVVIGDARDVDDHILDTDVEQVLDALADLVHPADQELVAEALEAPPLPVRLDRGVPIRAIF